MSEQRYGFPPHRGCWCPVRTRAVSTILIVELGAVGVRYVLRQDFQQDVPAWTSDEAFAERVLRCAVDLTSSRRIGKTAICASGGGITGIYYEMGVLKCLDDCLTNCGVNDFDMMFGHQCRGRGHEPVVGRLHPGRAHRGDCRRGRRARSSPVVEPFAPLPLQSPGTSVGA